MLTRLTLADGSQYTRTARTRKLWKSALMQLVPYGAPASKHSLHL